MQKTGQSIYCINSFLTALKKCPATIVHIYWYCFHVDLRERDSSTRGSGKDFLVLFLEQMCHSCFTHFGILPPCLATEVGCSVFMSAYRHNPAPIEHPPPPCNVQDLLAVGFTQTHQEYIVQMLQFSSPETLTFQDININSIDISILKFNTFVLQQQSYL